MSTMILKLLNNKSGLAHDFDNYFSSYNLLRVGVSVPRARGRPSTSSPQPAKRICIETRPLGDVRLDRVDHLPEQDRKMLLAAKN